MPKQVIRFLNDAHNRALIRGVIAAGNTNFGDGLLPRRRHHRRQVPRAPPVPLRTLRHTRRRRSASATDWNDFGNDSTCTDRRRSAHGRAARGRAAWTTTPSTRC